MNLTKLDIGCLYGQVHFLAKIEKVQLSEQLHDTIQPVTLSQSADYFKGINLPIEVGIYILSIFRPHIGLTFSFPLGSEVTLDKSKPSQTVLRELCKKSVNGFIGGIGIDFLGFLLDLNVESKLRAMTINPGNVLFGEKNPSAL